MQLLASKTPAGTDQSGKRSYNKCSACRHDKQKCAPITRDWINNGERCQRCIQKNWSCSANTRMNDLPLQTQPPGEPEAGAAAPIACPAVSRDSCTPHPHAASLTHTATQRADGDSLGDHRREEVSKSSASGTAVPPAIDPGKVDDVRPGLPHAARSRRASGIQEKFCQLNQFQDRYTYLHKRKCEVCLLRAVLNSVLVPDDERSFEYVLRFLEFGIFLSKEKFADYSERILEILEDVDPTEKEGSLLRLRAALELFANTAREPQADKNTETNDSVRLSALQQSTLQQLISTYEQSGDHSEIQRLRTQIVLSTESAISLNAKPDLRAEASALQEMSMELKRLLRNLDHENPYTKYLLLSGTSFPPVQIALLLNRMPVALFLCSDSQFRAHEVDILGRHALSIAVELSNMDFLQHMAQRDPVTLMTLLSARDMWSLSPLCIAAYSGNIEIFKALVSAGAKLDETDGQGRDVLYYASASGQIPIVSFLLEQNPLPRNTKWRLELALYGAAAAGHEAVCRKLVKKGAQISWAHPDGRTASARDVADANDHHSIAEFLARTEEGQRIMQTNFSGDGSTFRPFSRAPRSISLARSFSSSFTPHQLFRGNTPSEPPTSTRDWTSGIGSSLVRQYQMMSVPIDNSGSSPLPSVGAPTPNTLPSIPQDWVFTDPVSLAVTGTAPLALPRSSSSSPHTENSWSTPTNFNAYSVLSSVCLTDEYGSASQEFETV